MLTKSTDCQSDEKVCKSRKQKLFPVFLLFWAIFAFAGFASALTPQILNLSLGRFSLAETAKSVGFCASGYFCQFSLKSCGFPGAETARGDFCSEGRISRRKNARPGVHAAGSACQKNFLEGRMRSIPVFADAKSDKKTVIIGNITPKTALLMAKRPAISQRAEALPPGSASQKSVSQLFGSPKRRTRRQVRLYD